ncbi:sushi, von Willebrand factor type A, EGF and pentraxin domain-containing protein 1-like [Watersipora subatra]|uniref:sushi, von Willebrand factor type A, EGF and pentraxin domain-containing protein 1-like n=1 Tax=Watersipora subatra TaxID=2589382 RepID=UPI00355B52D9
MDRSSSDSVSQTGTNHATGKEIKNRVERPWVRCSSAPYMDKASHDFVLSSQRSRSTSRTSYGYYHGYDSYYRRYCSGYCRGQHTVYAIQYFTHSETREIYYTGYVTFTCNTNYYLPDGSRTVRTYCGDQGNWIAPNGTCQGRDCGPLPSMVGVSCSGSSTRYPNTKSCSCNSGYDRTNSLRFTLSCQASGSWSTSSDGRPASCTKVNCGSPPVIQNSNVQATVQNGTRYQDRVTYTCLPGYEVRTGSYSIICQANKRWTSVPSCIRKNCGEPPSIQNGGISRHLYNTTFDTELRYSCDSLGYNMVGSALVRCLESGTWSTPPICHKVNCGPPPFVQNSERHVLGHAYNDTVRYECDIGYELIGDESITCQVTGYWTIPPICQELECEQPPDIENTENSTLITGTEVGSEARYSCLPGYQMTGEPVIECLANQQWSTPPQCQRIRCGNPPQIQNGVRRVYGHYLNDRTKYRCHTGYLMVGDEFIYCETNGHWTVPPECDVITCGMPPTPDNAGLVSFTGTQFGQTATYQCLPDYTTDDPTYITCQLNGEWSRAPNCSSIKPQSKETTCGIPSTLDNARLISVIGTYLGQTAIYQCLPGYATDDPTYITCQSNGTWSRAPNCTLTHPVTTKPTQTKSTLRPTWSMSETVSSSTAKQTKVVMTTTEAVTSPPWLITSLPSTRPPSTVHRFMPTTDAGQSATETLPPTSTNKPVSHYWSTSGPDHLTDQLQTSSYSDTTVAEPVQSSSDSQQIVTTQISSTELPQAFEASQSSAEQAQSLETSQSSTEQPQTLITSQSFKEISLASKISQITASPAGTTPDIGTSRRVTLTDLFTSPLNFSLNISPTAKTSSKPISSTKAELTSLTPSQQPLRLPTPNVHDTKILLPNNSKPLNTVNYKYLTDLPVNRESTTLSSISTEGETDKPTVSNYEKTTVITEAAKRLSESSSEKLARAGSNHPGSALIGASAALVVVAVIMIAVAIYIMRKRRRGEMNFVSVSNALYETDGQTMTTYSFKEGCPTPD